MENYIWLIPIAPLLGAIINGKLAVFYSTREGNASEKLVAFIGCLAPLTSFVVGAVVFLHMLGVAPEHRIVTQTCFPRIVAGDLQNEFALLHDSLSSFMVLVVTGLASAYVLQSYRGTLEQVLVLAFFVPLLCGSGGNAGSQSSTVVIRALSTGDLQLSDFFKCCISAMYRQQHTVDAFRIRGFEFFYYSIDAF